MNPKLYSLPTLCRFFFFGILLFLARTSSAQIITTIAGNGLAGFSGDGGLAIAARLYYPFAVSSDGAGNLLIPDTYNYRLRRVSSRGIINTIAGTGAWGFSGDGGPATAAQFGYVSSAIVDGSGNTYVADYSNQRVRKIDASGIVTTFAGTGSWGFSGDGGAATAAKLYDPYGLAADAAGNIYIADYGNNRVRKVDPSGIITTVAGSSSTGGFSGDGGAATAAKLYYPLGVALDGAGNLLIADYYNDRIRKVNGAGIITTVAGTGIAGFSGDGGAATSAQIYYPYSVAADAIGNVYIGDYGNQRIRKIDTFGVMNTIAGNGMGGFCCDGTPATGAMLHYPTGVTVDALGNVYIADYYNNRIRMVRNGNRPPHFLSGRTQTMTVCDDTLGFSINSQLAISDSDFWQTEVWDTLKTPSHGTLNATFVAVSFSGTITPTGLTYSPAAGFSGRDTFIITVNDGVAYDTTTIYVNVNRIPGFITGNTSVCLGLTNTLSDTSAGGVWTSSTPSVASVGSSGAVGSVSVGTSTISYTFPATGCYVTAVVTVNPLPASITGPGAVCAGSAINLSDATAGGSWSSGSTAIATAGTGTGVVTGVSPGTSMITYALPTGCLATASVLVNPTPVSITGSLGVCVGLSVTLSDASAGGSWSSSNSAVASVGSGTGTVLGVSAGTANITYSFATGCMAMVTVTVNPLPSIITGPSGICAGTTTNLSDATAGGTWSSSNTAIATMASSSGTVYAITAGTTNITYTLPTGCIATSPFTVFPLPLAITGSTAVCAGLTITLSDATAGGNWSSSNTAVATAGSGTGVIGGVAAGTVTISYSLSGSGCTATTIVTVNPLPAAISGANNVCSGATTNLSDATSGGVWSSGTTSVATVGAISGIVSGVTAGTTNITYSLGTGCVTTMPMTVNMTPPSISGVTTVCRGTTSNLSDMLGGGTWSSSGVFIASIGSTSGIVLGVSIGTATISYTMPGSGCYVTTPVTVNAAPVAITGTARVCAGQTTALTDATAGGAWSSSAPAIASIGTAGVVTGIGAGTTIISYAVGSCIVTTSLVVNPLGNITGVTGICIGGTTLLSDAVTGGTWSSTNTSTATISSSGSVTSVGVGTTTISYALSTGCTATSIVTVSPLPSVITGATGVCIGQATALSDASAGGSWSSSNTAVASIGSISGITTGISAGTSTITYTLPTGCAVTVRVNVYSLPAAITGPTILCPATTVNLTDASPGGNWSSSNTAVATVGTGSGVVSGVAAGTTIVSYTQGTGCSSTATVTVNSLPSAITGPASVCMGLTTTLSNAGSGGTWSSGSTGVATVGLLTGIVSGVSAGTSTITYSSGVGCFVTRSIAVNPLAPVTGITSMCSGLGSTLSDAAGGGTWSSSNTSIATVGAGTGFVTGSGPGTAMITYLLPTGCMATTSVSVNSAPGPISGSTSVCAGSVSALSDAGGGAWSSANPAIASVGTGTGIVTGIASGTTSITYSLGTGCTTSTVVTVQPVPSAITGATSVCTGATTSLSDVTGGGTWSSSATTVGTITTGGVVSGIIPGTTTISYSLPSGCAVTAIVTVNSAPPAITGISRVCTGATTALTDAGGGTWTSGAPSVATVGAGTGVVTGIATGTTIVTYSLGGSCIASAIVTVNSTPSAISGSSNICTGLSITLSDGTGGGTWSSGATAVATAGAGTGVISGAGAGIATISYTLGTGCYAVKTITVYPLPTGISGTMNVCVSGTTTLSNGVGGGTWSSASAGIATIDPAAGTVTGVSAGTSTIIYTLAGGCTASSVIRVNPTPVAITGATNICAGLTTSLSDATGGGTWTSSNTTIATVGAGTGVVTGVLAGTAGITYALATGCHVSTIVNVNSVPPAVSGPATICAGTTTTLSDAGGGGTWSSSRPGVAAIGSTTGLVSGIAAGTTTIIYSIGAGCNATTIFTVNALPPAITGSTQVCYGQPAVLSDPLAGGTWSSGAVTTATVDAVTGIVTGVATGTSPISYTHGGCTTVTTVTVNALPPAIMGSTVICNGLSAVLTDLVTGGTWSSSNAAVATIGAGTGSMTGVSVGGANITYTSPAGCTTSTPVIVNPAPSAIMGASHLCEGATISLSDLTAGGMWSSGNTSIATVDIISGMVTGVAGGTVMVSYQVSGCPAIAYITVNTTPAPISGIRTMCAGGDTMRITDADAGGLWNSVYIGISATGLVSSFAAGTGIITYTLPTGCYTTATINVNPLPAFISGTADVCVGGTTLLSDLTGGGIWSSSTAAVAIVGSGSGLVSGIAAGTSEITYQLITTGCYVTKTVTTVTFPSAGTIAGASNVCVGAVTTLSDPAGGGAWSSGATGIAAVGASTGVVSGMAAGAMLVSYSVSNVCGTAVATQAMTVIPLPDAGVISPATTSVCVGATTTLTDPSAGGVWNAAHTNISVVAGAVTGQAAGLDTVIYTVTNACGTATTKAAITIDPLPESGIITGTDSVCPGGTIALQSSVAGGAWSSTSGTVAVGTSTGIVTALSAGGAIITYSVSNNCGTATTTKQVYVRSLMECNTGVAGISQRSGNLAIYPNPNKGVFIVNLQSLQDVEMKLVITDIAGKQVGETTAVTNKDVRVNMNQVAPGIYILKAVTEQGSFEAKVVVGE
jgi:trimeric autotransporter adhesin